MNIFVLDACALIAYFAKENGSENIKSILKEAIDNTNTKIFMNKVNLFEVYYDVIKNYNKHEADKMLETVKEMPIERGSCKTSVLQLQPLKNAFFVRL
jgi:PIN domain nuclease of toxin-antitoxin system